MSTCNLSQKFNKVKEFLGAIGTPECLCGSSCKRAKLIFILLILLGEIMLLSDLSDSDDTIDKLLFKCVDREQKKPRWDPVTS